MSLLFYNLFLLLYKTGIRIASLWNPKAYLWIKGRRTTFKSLGTNTKTVWMHCASLGEFEQGRPVIEAIKKQFPSYKIVLSFFSPSGYEIRKNYAGADAVVYLPMDGPVSAAKFIDAVNPSLVIWVKYEYWYYYLTTLQQRNIPVLLVSGIFRPGQPFFKWYGRVWIKMLHSFKHLFVQTETSKILLQRIGINENISVNGDTRFDRVLDIANNFKPLHSKLQSFCNGKKVIVAGSTWDDDEAELIHYAKAHAEIIFIIAPHEVDEENINDVQKEFEGSIRYSTLINEVEGDNDAHILIIDNIGMLSSLYYYADVTYVGGGFNDSGIHNILEAAVFGKPVIFGPEYDRSEEAKQLIETEAAFSFENAIELEKILDRFFTDNAYLAACSERAKEYVMANGGATEKTMAVIQEKRLLTS